MPKPKLSKDEMNYYKQMVGMIIAGDEEKKRRMDGIARMSIAKAKQEMPNADPEVLVSFFSSIAYLVAHIMAAPLRNVTTILETTFDTYTVAAAHEAGAYDIDGQEVPVRPEPPAEGQQQQQQQDPSLQAELDKILNRQYL